MDKTEAEVAAPQPEVVPTSTTEDGELPSATPPRTRQAVQFAGVRVVSENTLEVEVTITAPGSPLHGRRARQRVRLDEVHLDEPAPPAPPSAVQIAQIATICAIAACKVVGINAGIHSAEFQKRFTEDLTLFFSK